VLKHLQTVRSLLLTDFLPTDPVASICRRSRSSGEQFLSGNCSNNFLALQLSLCLKTLISIPSPLVQTIAFLHQSNASQKCNHHYVITSLFVVLPAVIILIGIVHIGKFCFQVPFFAVDFVEICNVCAKSC